MGAVTFRHCEPCGSTRLHVVLGANRITGYECRTCGHTIELIADPADEPQPHNRDAAPNSNV